MLDKPEVQAGVTEQPRFPPWEFDAQESILQLIDIYTSGLIPFPLYRDFPDKNSDFTCPLHYLAAQSVTSISSFDAL